MNIKERIKQTKEKITQLYLAIKSKDTPWYAKAIGGVTIAYALSPIDLIPDFIPVLGYLDDLIMLPLLIKLAILLIPKEVWVDCEIKAKEIWKDGKPKIWYFAIPIVLIWLLVIYLVIRRFL
ncbi:MAG: DUF1232 domain-containing protein [Tenericutes bacterium]|nr:DUF1232 domain-containing protein [Mycoplasmatota bacterium]